MLSWRAGRRDMFLFGIILYIVRMVSFIFPNIHGILSFTAVASAAIRFETSFNISAKLFLKFTTNVYNNNNKNKNNNNIIY